MKTVMTIGGLLFCSLFVTGISPAQQQPSPPAASSAKKGVEPPAPPPVGEAVVLPANCLAYQSAILAPNQIQPPNTQMSAVAEMRITFFQTPEKKWVVKCGYPDNMPYPQYYNGGDRTATQIRVWTADDSKEQFDFLHREVERMIYAAVKDNVVKDETLQRSVSDALQENKTVKDAVNMALQNSAVLQKAVSDALAAKLPDFKDQIVKEVLQKIKEANQN